MSRTLRVVVIGQSPQPGIEAEIAQVVPGVAVQLESALDGMTREQIVTQVAARSKADALFTLLPSGETVTISKEFVTARLATRLEGRGPALLCSTGTFKGLPRRDNIVQPSDLLNAMVDVLLPTGMLGLFVPLPEQVETRGEERARPGVCTVAMALRPKSDLAATVAAAHRMAMERPDLVIMDCMSYTRADMARVAKVLPCLVVLPIVAAARAVATLLAV